MDLVPVHSYIQQKTVRWSTYPCQTISRTDGGVDSEAISAFFSFNVHHILSWKTERHCLPTRKAKKYRYQEDRHHAKSKTKIKNWVHGSLKRFKSNIRKNGNIPICKSCLLLSKILRFSKPCIRCFYVEPSIHFFFYTLNCGYKPHIPEWSSSERQVLLADGT